MGDEDLFARMQRTKNGWGQRDLEQLYLSYGFDRREGGNHTIYTHSADPAVLRATVARHGSLATGYIQTAIKLIRHLKALQAKEKESQ
jgi:hypothetical protein